MARVASGQVADRPFGRTVYAIAARRFTGELQVVHEGRTYRVGWAQGQITAADSPSPADTVGRVAMAAGLVTTAQLADALRLIARGGGGSQLEIIAQVAGLDPERSRLLRRQVVAHRALRLFALDGARFDLDDQCTLEVDAEVPPLDPLWVIYHGVSTHYSEARLRRELDGAAGGQRLALVEEAIGMLGRFGFEPSVRALLQRLRQQPLSVAEATAGLQDDQAHEAMAVLYCLWCCACANAVGEAKPDSKPAAAAPVPAPAPAAPIPQPGPAPAVKRETKRPAPRAADARVVIPKTRSLGIEEARALVRSKLELVRRGADHFALLGVDRNVSRDELQRVYLQLAKVLHPDRLRAYAIDDPDGELGKIFAVVNQAFAVLGDPAQRERYAAKLTSGVDDDAQAEELAARLFAAEEAFLRGQAALRRNAPAAAVPEFRRAVEMNPDEGEHVAMLAWATWCAAADKEAVGKEVRTLFTRAIAMAPRCTPAYFYRGQVAKQQNNGEVALECFRKVLELEPDHKEAELELRLLTARAEKDKKGGGLFDKLRGR